MATPNDVNLVTPDPTNDYCLASGISGDQQKWNPTVILVGAGVTSIGSGAIITAVERMAITTNTSHATGSGSDHSDVAANTVKLGTITSVGSGAIITTLERTSLTTSTAHIAGSGLDHSQVATNTTKLATITSVGSGDIITTAERAQVPSSPSAGQVNYVWGAVSAGTAAWIAQPASEDPNDRGWYADLATLQAASPLDPAETAGDFAQLINSGSDATLAVWDADAGPAAWIEIGVGAVTSVDFGGGGGAQVGVISIDSDDIGEGATNLWLTVAERAAVAASTTHETSTGADHTYIDQDVTSGSSPVLAVTNMTGSAAGLDSDATTHAASDGSSHTFLDQDVTSGSSPVLAVTNFTGTLAGIDSDATAHAASDGASHDFINQSVIAGAAPTFAGTNFTSIPALAITETLSAPLVWEFDDDVSDDDPTTGKFSGDNAAITAWNQINISPTSDDSLVVSSILAALRTGDFITIRQRGLASTKSAIFSVTATPTNAGTYYTIPVTWVYSSGKPADASKCQIDFQSMSSTGQFVWDSIAQLKAVTVGITNGDMFSVKGDPDLFQYDSAIVVFDEVQTYEATGLGAGAYVRQAWDSATVTPEMFGAAADDTTDDHDAIENCLKYASENNKDVLLTGKYYTATDITLTTADPAVDMTITGAGKAQIRTDADITVLELSGSATPATDGDLTIKGITFVANNTGVQQYAIHATSIQRFRVTGCTFKTFGGASNVEPIVYAFKCEDVMFDHNYSVDCQGQSSAGFSIGNAPTSGGKIKGLISNNVIFGNGTLSEGISVGSTIPSDVGLITISGNVIDSPGRHCILTGYAGFDNRTGITGNVCHNAPWTAVYSPVSAGIDGGRVNIVGNTISCCGGGHTFGGAIYLRGNQGFNVSGNYIYNTGYDEDGVAHSANNAHSIVVIPGWNHSATDRQSYSITGNTMIHSKTDHIRLESFTGNNLSNVLISGNTLVDAETYHIWVQAISTTSGTHTGADNASVLTDSTEAWVVDSLIGRLIENVTDGSEGIITDNDATTVTATLSGGTDDDWDTGDTWRIPDYVTDVTIHGNKIINKNEDAVGIRTTVTNNGRFGDITITDNVFKGVKAGTATYAIDLQRCPETGVISGNRIDNWDYAFVETGGTWYSDKQIGNSVIIRNNHCHDIGNAVYVLGASGKAAIVEGATFSGTINSDGFDGFCYHGKSIGGGRFEIYDPDTSPPNASSGEWQQGSHIWDQTPSASGKIGSVCTSTGTVGTWKDWGVIDA